MMWSNSILDKIANDLHHNNHVAFGLGAHDVFTLCLIAIQLLLIAVFVIDVVLDQK